ncbi:hypothetical protein [Aeromonas caviae]|uniref:hypothetical protein n=1 Tax=Aeromonas caviae TaxID=648 RepID=UPI002B45F504|nr:hypothetical protein [Aeromonas caviae]
MDRNLSNLAGVVSTLASNQSVLQDQIDIINMERERVAREKYISEMKEIYSSSWSAAATYTNVIILAGYAGYFGLLSTLKDYVSPLGLLLSGFFMALSLAFFVFHEVFRMAFVGVQYNKIFKDLEEGDNIFEKMKDNVQKYNVITSRVWLFAFCPTVLFGLIGVGSVIYSFCKSLVPFVSHLYT